MKKQIAAMLLIALCVISTSIVFDVHAEDQPEPVINNFYCAPNIVVVCKWRSEGLECHEFTSVEDAEVYIDDN